MGLINDCLDDALEKELEDLLKPFVQESDFVHDAWRPDPVFNYTACIKRVVAELSKLKDLNKEIACGHSKADLWKESHAKAQEYCTVCRLHDEIEENSALAEEWRVAVEDALGLESDPENHTPEWAGEVILKIREIGNQK
jgi:hypothetical protein